MDAVVFRNRYLRITRFYMHTIGVWPDQNKYSKYILWTVASTITVSFWIAKILHLVYFFDMDVLMEQLCTLMTVVMSSIKHIVHIVKHAEFKVLWDGMARDMEMDTSIEEQNVMIPYLDKAFILTSIYAHAAEVTVIIFIQLPLLPCIADILLPLNETRPRESIFPVYYYFADVEDTYYLGLVHVDLAVILIMCQSISCDTFYIFTTQHACGLFAIAGCRFRGAIKDTEGVEQMPGISADTYRKVCKCIMAHDRAIMHVKEIDDFYYGILFVAVGLTVAGMSTTLFWLSTSKVDKQFYSHILFVLMELCHILFLTSQGQFVINQTDRFYNEICEGLWYKSVPKTQALFILALRTAIDPPQITAGGIVAMNLQTFSEVVKVSFSYFTVLQSV